MKLQDYLHRIGYQGDLLPTLEVLTALQRAHVCSVPFENLDVQFRRPVSLAVEDAYEKIVNKNRGGWCFEQNGLFGWALAALGFDVTRMAASVMRQERKHAAEANHLCLKVTCPQSDAAYLVDVGFGGSLLRPIELRESQTYQAPFHIGLQELDDGRWRFWEDIGRGKFSYDFFAHGADESALQTQCDFLQTDASSMFVLNTVAQLRTPDAHKSLRGRVVSVATGYGIETRVIDSPDQLVATLADDFLLHLPEAADLWPRIVARHELLRHEKSIEDTFEVRSRSVS